MELEFNLDLTTVKQIKPIPSSIVVLNIDSVKGFTSKAGNSCLRYATTILAPDEITEEVDKFYFNVTVIPECAWLIQQLQLAAGIELVPGTFDAQACIGQQVGAKITMKMDPQYGAQNQVTAFYAVEDKAPEVIGDWPEED